MADFGGSNSLISKHDEGVNSSTLPASDLGRLQTASVTVSTGCQPGFTTPNQELNKRTVLHVDLNSTILVSDAVTCQGTIAALDYFLTTVTWGKINKHGKWEWLSDSPSLLPPSGEAVSYYSQFGRTPAFTSGPGRRFRKYLDEHLDLLLWPEGVKGDRELSSRGEDGRLYHWIVPSFFQLLKDLRQENRDFSIVFRTFGTDLQRVLRVMNRALNEGAHPLFPDLIDLKLTVNMNPGKIRCGKKKMVLSQGQHQVSTTVDGERGLYNYLSSVQGLAGFQDHFDWWAQNKCSICGGKPMWINPFDKTVQHIFIDDNIRQKDEDTIVQPRVFLDPDGDQIRLASTSELYDLTLVQTDLLKAISDPHYFTERVHICLENYERTLQQ